MTLCDTSYATRRRGGAPSMDGHPDAFFFVGFHASCRCTYSTTRCCQRSEALSSALTQSGVELMIKLIQTDPVCYQSIA